MFIPMLAPSILFFNQKKMGIPYSACTSIYDVNPIASDSGNDPSISSRSIEWNVNSRYIFGSRKGDPSRTPPDPDERNMGTTLDPLDVALWT